MGTWLTAILVSAMLSGTPGAASSDKAEPSPAGKARKLSGRNLRGWKVVLGDAVYTAPGESEPDAEDIETIHTRSHSELRANIRKRRIMAHNITFKKVTADGALACAHACGYEFRLVRVPSKTEGDLKAQTIEGGMFVWDGKKTRLDYGVAFQWVLNPWSDDFGALQTWTGEKSGKWVPAGKLKPDTEWHKLEIMFDFRGRKSSLKIDGKALKCGFSGTKKPKDWGKTVDARLQAEIVSVYPGKTGRGALHKALFRNWLWEWKVGKD
jgi:hypothetical protein